MKIPFTVVMTTPDDDQFVVHVFAGTVRDAEEEAAVRVGIDQLPHNVAAVFFGYHDDARET